MQANYTYIQAYLLVGNNLKAKAIRLSGFHTSLSALSRCKL